MSNDIGYRLATARGIITNAVNEASTTLELPAGVMSGVLSSVILEINTQEKLEILNYANAQLEAKDAELKKAKEEAKKVLKADKEGDEKT